MIFKALEWGSAALVGALVVYIAKGFVVPLLNDLLYLHVPKIRGKWRSRNRQTVEDGTVIEFDEVIFVRQCGTRVWGHTETGPQVEGHTGNSFRGIIRGRYTYLTYASRTPGNPIHGFMIIRLLSTSRATGIAYAVIGDRFLSQTECDIRKEAV